MKKSLLFFLLLFVSFTNAYSHRGEYLAVENVEVIDNGSDYTIRFNLENIKNIDLPDVKIEFWVNGETMRWRKFKLIPATAKNTPIEFKVYKNKFDPIKDKYQIEITALFGTKNDWGGYDSPEPDGGNGRQKNEPSYEVVADAPWRMSLNDKDGNLQGIPVHIFAHDGSGTIGIKLDNISIKLKDAGLTSFGSTLTYNSLTDTEFKAMFSCASETDVALEIQEFEMSAFKKSSSYTMDFDKTDPFIGDDYFKISKEFAYITFTIPPSSLVGYSNVIDIEVEMDLIFPEPNRTYRFRVFRSNEDIPKQPNWYRGDTHLHSIYTQNGAEMGLPLCATKEAAKLIGIDWITTTDHTSDIDNYGTTINSNWNRILQDIRDQNLTDKSMLYIPGQEVAVKNNSGDLVHMLAYPSYTNPQNFPFLGDGDGDVSGTSVTVSHVITALTSFNGFSYAAHPFSTADKLPTIPVGGGIWNLKDPTFPDNSGSFPRTGGNIICNDMGEDSDILTSEINKYIVDAVKGGQIWNVRNSLETGGDDRDPWDVKNSSSSEFSKGDTSSLSHHIKKFRQGQEVINQINKKGLYWRNQNKFLKNWKFYISAGTDAHGSFNFSNTDDFLGLSGTIHDNAVGKLATIAYCPNGMGENGENVLEAMYNGHTTLSDGPILTIGVSTDAKPEDDELLMGDDGVVNSFLPSDYHLNLNYTTTQEFGDVNKLVLYVGTESGELAKSISITNPNGDNVLSFNLKNILDSVFTTTEIPLDEYFYVRAELQTRITGLSSNIYRTTYDEYWSFTNPIWLQFKEIPLPEKFSIKAHPNPFDDDFNLMVENPTKGDVVIKIYDNIGNLIYNKVKYVTEEETVNINTVQLNLAKGTYIVNATMGDEKQSLKLIKF